MREDLPAVVMRRQVVQYFAVVGLAIPFLIIASVALKQGVYGSPTADWIYYVSMYLWPSSWMFWMTPRDSVTQSVLLFSLAAAINIVLYAFIGMLVGYVFSTLRTRKWG